MVTMIPKVLESNEIKVSKTRLKDMCNSPVVWRNIDIYILNIYGIGLVRGLHFSKIK